MLAATTTTRGEHDDAAPRTNTVTTTVQSNPTPPPATVSIQVPSVVGQTRGDAERALDNAGLAIVVATVPGAPPAGQVLAQNPAAGGTLKSGDPVRINVSDGQAVGGRAAQTPQPTTPRRRRQHARPRRRDADAGHAPTTTAAGSPSTHAVEPARRAAVEHAAPTPVACRR